MTFPKLISLLVLLPGIITYLHMKHRKKTSHIVVVTPVAASHGTMENVHGIYRATSNKIYRQIALTGCIERWPSIGLIGSIIAPPNTEGFNSFLQLVVDILDTMDKTLQDRSSNFLTYKNSTWCISGELQLCVSGKGKMIFQRLGYIASIMWAQMLTVDASM
jgi:hypothetical protein